MVEEEKFVTLNLRKDLVKAPKWNRGTFAVRILKKKLKKIVKTETIKIDKRVNEKIWSRGIKKPTSKLRVRITKVDEKTSKVELVK